MADLGSFAAAAAEAAGDVEQDTFAVAGETFTARSPLPALALMEYAAASLDDPAPAQVIGALHAFLRAAIIPADWTRFRRTCLDAGVDTDTLVAVSRSLIQAAAVRPTGRPSASPSGPSTGGNGSKPPPSQEPSQQPIRSLPLPA